MPARRDRQIKVWRKGAWFPTKDLGHVDADGCFYHDGRADDVIISAGWTMSAVEIEDIILTHPEVTAAAAIGIPDPVRGQIVKAFVVASAPGTPGSCKKSRPRAQQAESARVSARRRIRRRPAPHTGRQDQPQSVAGRCCPFERIDILTTVDKFPRITDATLDDLRSRVGKVVPRPQPYIETATEDAIRHWTMGIGDRNPLHMDAAYAAKTAYGTLMAPPTSCLRWIGS